MIRVSFAVAPETVKIRIEPEELRPGMEATIICDSSSSNPPAKLSWWKDGISIEGTLANTNWNFAHGLGGAVLSKWQLLLPPVTVAAAARVHVQLFLGLF